MGNPTSGRVYITKIGVIIAKNNYYPFSEGY